MDAVLLLVRSDLGHLSLFLLPLAVCIENNCMSAHTSTGCTRLRIPSAARGRDIRCFLCVPKVPTPSPFSVFPAAAIPRTYLTHANTLIHTAIILLTLARHCIDLFLCLGSMDERDRGE